MEYFVLAEVSQKQGYIFKSNKLKENIGGSIVIRNLTETEPVEFLEKHSGRIIFEGGGKSFYAFRTKESARAFVSDLSKLTFKKYPGSEMFFVIQEADLERDLITEIMDGAYKQLAKKKNQRMGTPRQVGFGIHRPCRSTSLPANRYKNDKGEHVALSGEVGAKLEEADRSGTEQFKELEYEGLSFISEFDDLTGNDNKSFMGVIHIDGNMMGDKINRFKDAFHKKNEKMDNRTYNDKYLKALAKLSKDIDNIYRDSFREMVAEIAADQSLLTDKLKVREGLMPLRPLIVAGDDITYVVNGKIALESARIFLEKVTEKKLDIEGEKKTMNACAGVALVNSHYPFSRAYDLAEELCKNAKTMIQTELNHGKTNEEKIDASLIDWHISYGDIGGDLSEIRNRHYTIDEGRLNLRPLVVTNADHWRTFKLFQDTHAQVTSERMPRNKVKEFREVMRKGPSRSEMYLRSNRIDSLFPALSAPQVRFGFAGEEGEKVALYYDAIEMIDMYMRVGGGQHANV